MKTSLLILIICSSGMGITMAQLSGNSPLIPPTVTTLAVGYTGCDDASLLGAVNANGSATTVSFEYGLTTAYGNNALWVSPATVNGTTNVNINGWASSLSAGTTYHYRCVASNSYGTSYGSDMTFTTYDSVPSVSTNAATNITGSTATLNGWVISSGQPATVSFQWGTTTAYGNTVAAVPPTVTGFSPELANISGLTLSTTYHFRIVATNSTGTTYGNDMLFTTIGPVAIVTTLAPAPVFARSAELKGTVNAVNNATNVSFELGTTTGYGTIVASIPSVVTGSNTTSVTGHAANLLPSTNYHYRCKGVNSGGTIYGGDITFVTNDTVPAVLTNNATLITSTTSQLNGSVNANNQATTVSFQWGTTTAYGNTSSGSPVLVNGTNATNVYAGISGLASSTTYHYRCVGVNGSGTTYGQDKTFTTSGIQAPTIYTDIATNITCQGAQLHGSANANGATTTVTFEYGPTSQLGFVVSAVPSPVSGTTLNNESAWISGLSPHTTYYFRCAGVNAGGASYGYDTTFMTGDTIPSVYTNPPTNTTPNSTTLNGSVNGNNLSSTVTFEYGTTTGYGNTASATPSVVSGGTFLPVSANITGLSDNTTYHFRCKAVSSAGTGYGADQTFTTGCNPPVTAGVIEGPDTVCMGYDSAIFTCAVIPGAIWYVWNVPYGFNIISGANTNTIIVNIGDSAISGIITVYGSDSCGNGPLSVKNIVVVPSPVTPTIMCNGPILLSSVVSGNQWFLNGVAVPDATTQEWDASISGSGIYWDVVTVAGIQSDTSNHIYILIEGIPDRKQPEVFIYPSPSDGKFNIKINVNFTEEMSVEVVDIKGIKIYDSGKFEVRESVEKQVDLKPVKPGIYIIIVKSGTTHLIRKLIINE